METLCQDKSQTNSLNKHTCRRVIKRSLRSETMAKYSMIIYATSLLPNPFTPNPIPHLLFRLRRTIKGISCTFGTSNPNSCTFGNPNSCTFGNLNSCTFMTRNPTSRLFSDAFPTIASLSKRTISLTGIRNTFVFMHIVSHVPNSLWDKQARAAHASWILYGKNLKEIALISTKIYYSSILANVLMNSGKCTTA